MSRYSISGRPVPSVTEIIRECIPGWMPDQWYLDRGQAVHACAALIAKGKDFECDPQIAGYVAACRKWFADMKPEAIAVELKVESVMFQYCGRLDLLAIIAGKRVVVDWKSGPVNTTVFQLAGYAAALPRELTPTNYGMEVVLHDDGTYKASPLLDLKLVRGEFLAMRTVYGIKQRLGLIKPEEQ